MQRVLTIRSQWNNGWCSKIYVIGHTNINDVVIVERRSNEKPYSPEEICYFSVFKELHAYIVEATTMSKVACDIHST